MAGENKIRLVRGEPERNHKSIKQKANEACSWSRGLPDGVYIVDTPFVNPNRDYGCAVYSVYLSFNSGEYKHFVKTSKPTA